MREPHHVGRVVYSVIHVICLCIPSIQPVSILNEKPNVKRFHHYYLCLYRSYKPKSYSKRKCRKKNEQNHSKKCVETNSPLYLGFRDYRVRTDYNTSI